MGDIGMMKKADILLIAVFFVLGVVPNSFADKGVFQTRVTPDEIFTTDLPATITVTSEIGDIPLNDISVNIFHVVSEGVLSRHLTSMYNDGTHGDARKDAFYTGQFILGGGNSETFFYFQIVAEYNGQEQYMSPMMTVDIFEPLEGGVFEGLNEALGALKRKFQFYLKENDLDKARMMVLQDAKDDTDITSAVLNGRTLSIVYKGGLRGIVFLDDPNGPSIDSLK